jgi:hypothetical protein
MSKKCLLLVCLVSILCSGSIASAGYYFWKGEGFAGTTTEWSAPSNWTDNSYNPVATAPTSADVPYVFRVNGPVIHAGDSATASSLIIADWGYTGKVSMTGGNLDLGWGLYLGYGAGSNGTFTMSNGTVTVGGPVEAGISGAGYVNLFGGTMSCNIVRLAQNAGSTGVINITNGTLLVWDTTNLTSYIASNKIVAYGGAGQIVVESTGHNGFTAITAIPEPITVTLLGIGGLLLRRKK